MVALMCSLAREKGWRKGPWTSEEDKLLSEYVNMHGEGRWSSVSKFTGLNRSGKSCRLRWVNYLRPGLKKGQLTPLEEGIIIELHEILGNKWSTIAKYLPGRTDNEIKNYWRTHFGKREKSKQKKLQRRKPNVLKQFKQKQQPKEYDVIKSTMSHLETKNETKSFETLQNNCDQHISGFMYPTMLEQQYYTVPSTYDGIFSSMCPPETLADADSWFSLWDFDKPQNFDDYVNHFSKCIVPNHATFGIEGDSMQTTQDKNSCFHDAYDNLFHGKDMFG